MLKMKLENASKADLDVCTWFDLGNLHDSNPNLTNGDSSMKAFTVTEIEDNSLNRIEIETPPKKVVYTEGESFDKSGMKIKAYFNNNDSKCFGIMLSIFKYEPHKAPIIA